MKQQLEYQTMIDSVLKTAKNSNAECLVSLSKSFSKELSMEAGHINLLRTNHDQSLSVKVYKDQKFAASSGNQFSADAAIATTQAALSSAQAAPQDPAHVLVDSQGEESFEAGLSEANDQWAIERFQNLLSSVKSRFPKLILENTVLRFNRRESMLVSSRGTRLSSRQGYYEGHVMFTTKDGTKSSSFNYTGFILGKEELSNPQFDLLNFGGLETLLQQSTEQTQVKKVPAKFEGDVIVTPHCMDSLLKPLLEHLGTNALMAKTSLFQDKVGQKVLSDKISLSANPRLASNRIQSFWTADGLKTENESIFRAGVLDRYLVGQYGSKKLGLPVSRSGGEHLVQKAG